MNFESNGDSKVTGLGIVSDEGSSGFPTLCSCYQNVCSSLSTPSSQCPLPGTALPVCPALACVAGR